MRTFGFLILGLGVATAIFAALGMRTDVEGVVNIGLLQNQQMVFQAGCALLIAGVVAVAAGAIVEMRPKRNPETSSDGIMLSACVVGSAIVGVILADGVSPPRPSLEAQKAQADADASLRRAEELSRELERLSR